MKTHESDDDIVIGATYRHPDPFGTEYVVTGKLLWVDGEEETGIIVPAVRYMQTKAGIYPVGTEYVRSIADFLSETIYKGATVKKFIRIDGDSLPPR